jgi:hypothetical protein
MFLMSIISNLIHTTTMDPVKRDFSTTINEGLCPNCCMASVSIGRTPRGTINGELWQFECCGKCHFTFVKYILHSNGGYGPDHWWFDDNENIKLIEKYNVK